jgi:hypothetical protein
LSSKELLGNNTGKTTQKVVTAVNNLGLRQHHLEFVYWDEDGKGIEKSNGDCAPHDDFREFHCRDSRLMLMSKYHREYK